MKSLFIFLFFLLIFNHSNAQVADECFSNFLVDTLSNKTKPEIQFLDDLYNFRTRIRETYKDQKVDFGGYYSVVTWGCGSSCQAHAFINLKTGEARSLLPFATALDIKVKPNSRLLITDPDAPENYFAKPSFFILENDSLIELNKNELPNNCFK